MRDFHQSGRSPVYSVNGMAATSMPIASLTAIEVLRAGGNAVDAAVAACAVLAVVEPQSTGLGGDCFCLYAPPGGKVVAVNGSGRSAGAASLDAIRAAGSTPPDDISPHGVTIPGAVSGWQVLLDAYGTKGFDELLLPAIRCAEEGFPVHQRVAWDWSMFEAKLRRAGNTLFLPGGRAPREGDRFVQTALAGTLRAIAKRGADAFYTGPVAADMAATLRARGGVQTEEDFANGLKGAEFVEPISIHWRGLDVWQCPPERAGSRRADDSGRTRSARRRSGRTRRASTRFHRHIEAARMAYRDRGAFLADPRQRETPLDRLLSRDYLAALAGHIDDQALPSRLARSRRNRARGERQYGHPFGRRPRRRRLQPDQLDLPDLRQRHPRRSAQASSCRTADCASPSSPAIRTALRRTRAPRTPSCRAWRRGTASPQSALA